MTEQDANEDTVPDAPRDRVFEFFEARIPRRCEVCKGGRPRMLFIKRLWGEQEKLAFTCDDCAQTLKRQANSVARKIAETLEANGGDVNVE